MEGLLCSQGCWKWDQLTLQRTKDWIRGKGKDDNFVQMKMLHFLIIKFKINIFLAKTVRCDAVQCEIRLYYWAELDSTNPIVQMSTF